jgi:adenine-specific DNA-methyltransferase
LTVDDEDPAFLTQQLITYLGNKRALLAFIGKGLDEVRRRLGQEKLRIFDVFSGSGSTTRFFKHWASLLVANDLEPYAEVLNSCYLANFNEVPHERLRLVHSELSRRLATEPLRAGFITELYSPRNDEAILPGERVFFTSRNARFFDTARTLLRDVPRDLQNFLLAPLVAEASVHANTSGVFKGFHKNPLTGVGQFGGGGKVALSRIQGEARLNYPVFSRFSCPSVVFRDEAQTAALKAPPVDVAYLDPPYNQHPYGSNYFMLNLLVQYERPLQISKVSGIPTDWNRSAYNHPKKAHSTLVELLDTLKTRFLLVSYNSEGFLSREDMLGILGRWGTTTILETPYNTFRGSRNLNGRNLRVQEYLYLVEKT